MKERIVAPFGVNTEGCQGLLDGIACKIVLVATHTETRDAIIVYYLPNDDEFYIRTFGDFVSRADSNLKAAAVSFSNVFVNDDFLGSNYRHFKGMWYRLMLIAKDAKTNESHCIYMQLYGNRQLCWCRPYDMFFSTTAGYADAKQPYRLMNYKEVVAYFGEEQAQQMIDSELKEFWEAIRCSL